MCDCPRLVQSHLFFFKISCLGNQNEKNNCREPSVSWQLLGLPHMVNTGPDPAWLAQSFKWGRSLIHTVDFDWNQIPVLVDFQRALRWGYERLRWSQLWNLWSQVMTRLDLQKFYYDLNENVINASKTLIDSAWEVNLNLSSGIIPFS